MNIRNTEQRISTITKTFVLLCMALICNKMLAQASNDSVINVIDKQDFENVLKWSEEEESNKELNKALPLIYHNNARSAYRWSLNSGDAEDIFQARFLLLKYYGTNFVADSMIVLANELMAYERFWEKEESVMTLHILTNVYRRQEQFNELLDLYPLYYRQIERFGDHLNRREFSFDHDLADVYFNLQNYEMAMVKYRKVLETCSRLDNQLMASSSENNLGLCYMELKDDQNAKRYFDLANTRIEKAIQANKDGDNGYLRHFQNVIRSNRAKYLVFEEKYDAAIPFLEKELRSSIVQLEKNITLGAYFGLAEVHYLSREPATALLYLDSTFSTLNDYIDTKTRLKALQLQSMCLMLLSKVEQADSVRLVYNQTKDSVDRQRVRNSVVLATVKYDTKQKEAELKLSEQKLEFEQRVSNYQRLGLVLLALGLFLIVLFYRRLEKNKQTIEENNKVIEQSLLEKETLLKEVHHRVKNNLQVISSLLDVKSSRFDNEELELVIEDSQRHIHSMAMVHKMLYQHNSFSIVSMQDYFTQLTDNILNALAQHALEVEIETDDIELDLDNAIPLGLIINEVLINTYKYAYPSKQGRVILSLRRDDKDNVIFEYRDFGVGLEPNSAKPSEGGWGMNLVKLLVEEMGAKLQIEQNKGLAYILTIPTE